MLSKSCNSSIKKQKTKNNRLKSSCKNKKEITCMLDIFIHLLHVLEYAKLKAVFRSNLLRKSKV